MVLNFFILGLWSEFGKTLFFLFLFLEVKKFSSVVVGLAAASCIANTYISKNMDIVKCDGGKEMR